MVLGETCVVYSAHGGGGGGGVFFFNDTATTEIYTLSLHDALPICLGHKTGSLAKEIRL